jgi:hypothetical protein
MGGALLEAIQALGGVQSKKALSDWIELRYPNKWKPNTLTGHLAGCSVNNPSGIKHHRSFPRFLYDRGNKQYEMYDPAKHGTFDATGLAAGQSTERPVDVAERLIDAIEETAEGEFAYESHLRDYLAKHLDKLESGLTLWNETEGTEFSIGNRRIDILARDASGHPVIVELKVSRGHERVVGQVLHYRAKLRQLLQAQKVRIILVAAEISEELMLTFSEVSDVSLFEYSLSMHVRRVPNTG